MRNLLFLALAPTVDSVKQENSGSLKVVKIEAYENKGLTKELGVIKLPILILYKNNKVVWRKTGVTPKAEIDNVLREQTL
ncbi:thioredoxin family protein [Dyadobacter arcticus]|uniref:Thioredoxin-like negative regulator of GroEL n=1 Tax=Dyadobacter arcticus TaxID=1078754 RepID=A0ABX0UKC1_9BACT|nr:thioredoxin family protein [Dyadobacter arcticus]NIJ52918.1 thioredoxin-like negative regulator of GroEL [Dyadobacter arcticus]